MKLWDPKARHCHIPPITLFSFLFYPFFFTFLSFSLLYLFFFLFFFRAKSSYSPTTHTGHSHADHTHADPSWEIIGVDLRSHVEKLHHALVLLIAAIVLVLRSGQSVEIGIHSNGGSPLETIQSGSLFFDLEALLSALGTALLSALGTALLSALGTAPLEACFWFGSSFYFIFYFVVYHK